MILAMIARMIPETTIESTQRVRPSRSDNGEDLVKKSQPSGRPRGRMGSVGGVAILGSGTFLPERVVTNEDLNALGCDSEWIVRRTGILERRHADAGQSTGDLCYEAAVRCLADAGVSAEELDLILVATITPDHFTPSTACLLQQRLGAFAPAMDLSAACAGFMYAMTTAAQFIATGNAKRVLVIGADLMSRTINPDDKKTYPLFGDGAGAVLMGPADEASETDSSGNDSANGSGQSLAPGILSFQLGSEGSGPEVLGIPAGGTRLPLTADICGTSDQYLNMDGRNVFKWAVRVFEESASDVLSDAGVDSDDLAMVVMHQANQRIIDSAVAALGVPTEKVFVNLDRYGNTSGASIPIVLDEAIKAGKLRSGDLALLCGFGSGLAWGTAVVRL
ncbi:MAG: beta-ketoacyl-ACP synthase III [Planctomycetota bacterium]